MPRGRSFLRNTFGFIFARSATEDRLAAYVIREHRNGRALKDILEDPFVANRTTEAQRNRLLDRPDVLHALGSDVVASHRDDS